MKQPEFTKEQEDWICCQIDEWYLIYKNKIVNYKDKTHRLGAAKEILKLLLCSSKQELIDELVNIYCEIDKVITE